MSDSPSTRPGRVRCVLATTFVGIGLLVPSLAGAQGIDPGVNYDPGSPAGKQYAIPLALGRAEGAGTEDQRAAANTPFGVGIRPRGRAEGNRSGGGASSRSGAAPKRDRAASAAERGRMVRAEEPADTALWSLVIALAVVLPAALLAAALSTRQPRTAE